MSDQGPTCIISSSEESGWADGRIGQAMEKDGSEGRRGAKTGAKNDSWFKGSAHYWAEASLPLAYAVACVEVVCQGSEKAGILYDRIVKAWSEAGAKAVCEKIASLIGESEKAKIREAVLHPERELLPDPNRPFRELEKLFLSRLLMWLTRQFVWAKNCLHGRQLGA